jgi:hypothetical protein
MISLAGTLLVTTFLASVRLCGCIAAGPETKQQQQNDRHPHVISPAETINVSQLPL